LPLLLLVLLALIVGLVLVWHGCVWASSDRSMQRAGEVKKEWHQGLAA
jgi:hypothetical protein